MKIINKKAVFSAVVAISLILTVFCVPASAAKSNSTNFAGLSDAQISEICAGVRKAAKEHKEDFSLEKYKIPHTTENINSFRSFIYVFSDLYYVDLSYSYNSLGYFYSVNLSYPYSAQDISAFEKNAGKILSGLKNGNLTDVEKALLVHDRMIVSCEYDTNEDIGDRSFTAIGAVVDGVAVCQGYTYAYKYFMDRLGIPCRIISSLTLYHTWNVITIDGKEYHVDVTWDDPLYDMIGHVSHLNFLRSSIGVQENGHSADDFDMTPDDTKYDNAFWQKSETEFQLLKGKIYYFDNEDGKLKVLKGSAITDLKENSDYWPAGEGGVWRGNYTKLVSDGSYLYLNDSKYVKRYSPSSNTLEPVYSPDGLEESESYSIFGLKVKDNILTILCDVTPNIYPEYGTTVYLDYKLSKKLNSYDLNGDGELNANDIILIRKSIIKNSTGEMYDLNNDGESNLFDLICLKKWLAA